ncbi:PAS domain-containing protein [candidate division WWE3 bacterium]|uniref:histidine kinase n=1 Tax=candidate division WWE3 bacterium TaxID=2053526 RepID=A0A955LJV5_UNCKA|nr:PAS domain-containing protein [candidate division WWE3 bacterium]
MQPLLTQIKNAIAKRIVPLSTVTVSVCCLLFFAYFVYDVIWWDSVVSLLFILTLTVITTETIVRLKPEDDDKLNSSEYTNFTHKTMINLLPEIYILVNNSGIILEINDKAPTVLGYKSEDILTRSISEAPFVNDEGKKVLTKMYTAKEPKRTKSSAINLITINKQIKKSKVVASALKNSEDLRVGTIFLISSIYSDDRIEETKKEFVSVVSHQLRTPLTAIKLFAEMLFNEEVGEINPQQKDYIGDIMQSTERMIKLVNDLLNVSRIEAGRISINPEPLEVENLIDTAVKDILPIASAWNCDIDFIRPETPLGSIPLDQALLYQVVYNLLSNAIKYSKRGGAKVSVELNKREKDFVISVQDNGIGIPKKDQKKLFTKFTRADNAITANTEGTGLGLYLVKLIVDTVGGDVWFKSEQDIGTTMYVSLPLSGMEKVKGERQLAS